MKHINDIKYKHKDSTSALKIASGKVWNRICEILNLKNLSLVIEFNQFLTIAIKGLTKAHS